MNRRLLCIVPGASDSGSAESEQKEEEPVHAALVAAQQKCLRMINKEKKNPEPTSTTGKNY